MSIERQVIGSLIISPDSFIDVSELLTVNTFAEEEARAIFEVFTELYHQEKGITIITLQNALKKKGNEFSVVNVITELDSGTAFIDHCQILKEREVTREQMKFASDVLSKASDPKQDPFYVNDVIMQEAERIVSMVDFGKTNNNQELVSSVTNKIHLAEQNKGLTGCLTGFTELDRIYGGRQDGDFIIKAARPAMGKTAQALCEAKYMAFETNKKVAVFSLEMSAEQLMQRLTSVHTGIPLNNIRSGNLDPTQWAMYNENVGYLTNDNLCIVDDVYSLNGIRTRCRKMKMQGRLDAIYIDYLQLIEHKVANGRNKENEVSEISRSLKMLAKSLEVPVIVLSQLSRAVETRGGTKRPMLSDLRDSGALEQDADIVEFIYRPEYYDKENSELFGQAFVLIAKNRSGSCGDIQMFFNQYCTRFENLEDRVMTEEKTIMKPSTEF